MSQFDNKKAAALKYDGGSKAPVVVAAGSGYVAQKIIDVAQESDIPVYQDNSLATLLAQLKVGSEIPPELYQAIVEIYVYFLKYIPDEKKIKTNYKEPELPPVSQHELDVLSVPDIKISDLAVSSVELSELEKQPPEPEKKTTFTLDELRAESDMDNLNIGFLEDLLEDF